MYVTHILFLYHFYTRYSYTLIHKEDKIMNENEIYKAVAICKERGGANDGTSLSESVSHGLKISPQDLHMISLKIRSLNNAKGFAHKSL